MALWSRESVLLWPSRARCSAMSEWRAWPSRMAPRSAARCPWALERRPPRPSRWSRPRPSFPSPSRSSRPRSRSRPRRSWPRRSWPRRSWRLRKSLRRPLSRRRRRLRWPSCEWPARTAKAGREQRRSRASPTRTRRSGARSRLLLLAGGLLGLGGFRWHGAGEGKRRCNPRLGRGRLGAPVGGRHHVALHRVSGHRLEIPATLLADGRGLVVRQSYEQVLTEKPAEHVAVDEGREVAEHRPHGHRGFVGHQLRERRLGVLAGLGHHAWPHLAH